MVPSVIGAVSPSTVSRVAELVRGCTTSDRLSRHVIDDGWVLHDIVQQDEFTLDWILGVEGVWLVFDTT
ncbi:MAG: hypothetical protein H6735_34120 [Alphaproteobacteria bacterium]|nr:hypothetical protein [Alphaproteobacteria bacterium]